MVQNSQMQDLRVKASRGLSNTPVIRLMDKILHDPKDPKLWELWYIPYYGSCRILSINSSKEPEGGVFLNQVPTVFPGIFTSWFLGKGCHRRAPELQKP